MKILIVSQYFFPESFLINDLTLKLAELGHSVTVVTGKPNYPTGKIAPGYRRKGIQRETFGENIQVFRIPLRPRGASSATALFLNYMSFAISGLLRTPLLLRGREYDVVFVFCTSPITVAIPAIFIGRLKNAHVALWIQDLWPESLSSTGFIRNRFILALIGKMVRLIYRFSDTLLVQSEAFTKPVASYADQSKIHYFPNFSPPMRASDAAGLPDDVRELMSNCFSVVFAGNLGKAQALPTIVEAAQRLKAYPDIRIILVGTGSEAARLARRLEEEHLSNVKLTGLLDRKLMPAVFQRASVLMITLRDDPSLGMTIPSKIQAYLQAGRPVVGALNGEGARLISASGAGLTVAAEDSEGLANSILTLHSMPAITRDNMGMSGRRYFDDHFELDKSARQLVEILNSRMRKRSQ